MKTVAMATGEQKRCSGRMQHLPNDDHHGTRTNCDQLHLVCHIQGEAAPTTAAPEEPPAAKPSADPPGEVITVGGSCIIAYDGLSRVGYGEPVGRKVVRHGCQPPVARFKVFILYASRAFTKGTAPFMPKRPAARLFQVKGVRVLT